MNSSNKLPTMTFSNITQQNAYRWAFIRLAIIVVVLLLFSRSQGTSYASSSLQTTNAVNTIGVLSWVSNETNLNTRSLAWGDFDNDADLDLAVGNYGQPSRLYLNVNGALQATPIWQSPLADNTSSVAWGDFDGDGDLDLAIGNDGQKNRIYKNNGGVLETNASWNSVEIGNTRSIAWGDANSDGRLDLAVGNYGQKNLIYYNATAGLSMTAGWASTESDPTTSVTWGDMNGDTLLDLAVGNDGLPNRVYVNTAGNLSATANWNAPTSYKTNSVTWHDINQDGKLDLVVATNPLSVPSIKIFLNDGGILQNSAGWESGDVNTTSMEWGDINNDGNIDLITISPSDSAGIRAYIHEGAGGLQWHSTLNTPSNSGNVSLALGDIDGDGDLDVATGGTGPLQIYLNQGRELAKNDSSFIGDDHGLAWGDVDSDGDLDLAASGVRTTVYKNDKGVLQITNPWVAINGGGRELAWGDMNGDGYLDLAVGGRQPIVYVNVNGQLQSTRGWVATPIAGVSGIAWGDMDGDGDLDLAAGRSTLPNVVFLNVNGMLQTTPIWQAADPGYTNSVAWGDMDGDGDLDLAAGTYGSLNPLGAASKVYLNDSGMLRATPAWISADKGYVVSVAWGDMDGDGDLDLAMGTGSQSYNKVYLNEKGILQPTAIWVSADANIADTNVAWGDVDGDGDLDLATGTAKVYTNKGGMLQPVAVWDNPNSTDASWADLDGDGNLDIGVNHGGSFQVFRGQKPGHLQNGGVVAVAIRSNADPVKTFSGQTTTALASANFYALAAIRQSGTIAITYDLFHPAKEPIGAVKAYYSLDGSFSSDRSKWREAKLVPGTQTTNLSTSIYPTRTLLSQHVFNWDVYASGFFGQSDNVVLRIEALPNLKPTVNGIPGPFQRPYIAAQTLPFRVRGSQVRVVRAGNPAQPVSGATVYRLPVNQVTNGLPFRSLNGNEVRTDPQGYLQGRGSLDIGDRLVALTPISATTLYTIYQTSATPAVDGLNAFTVSRSGVQTLTVAATNPLILFNPIISLEWDARNDPTFMAQLQNDIRRASQILYDVTNGQAALGRVRIYHDKGYWGTANVVITANNDQRPNAILGGSVSAPLNDVDISNTVIQDAYVPGQVRIGATWNRFGDPDGTIGEDWPSVLAHELGHYFFFVADDYIGVTADRKFIKIVDCPGTLMTDPYDDRYSEFVATANWSGQCLETVAARYLGRADWQTITKFYPMLNGTTINTGPSQLPLAVTQVEIFAPPAATKTLLDPFFSLVDNTNKTITIPDGRGQAYLFKTQGNSDPTDDYLIALGIPIGDQIRARGVAPGDRLCVFDYSRSPLRFGCVSPVGNVPTPVQLLSISNWQPQIRVTGVTTNTVAITVTNIHTTSPLSVQLLPALGVASSEVAMTRQGNSFVQRVTAADGAYFGYVRIWVPNSNPLREMIVEYAAIEAWNGRARAWGTPGDAWGGRARAWGVNAYSWGGRARAWGAPVMSSDGQVSLFPLDNPFAGGARFALQTVAFPPTLPAWLRSVGQAYRVTSDGVLPPSAILFSYLPRNVPSGYEEQLTVYFLADEGKNWQRLTTTLDTRRNQASASVAGKGIYVLVVTVPVRPTFAIGWNNFGYTIQTSQPITQALTSIQGKYSAVYSYVPGLAKPWLFYDPKVQPAFDSTVNTLRRLDDGKGYWLYATQAITLYLGVGSASVTEELAEETETTVTPSTPAIYYGWVIPSAVFTPTVGLSVTAWVDNVSCGETTVELLNGQLAYVLPVAASDEGGDTVGCGSPGKEVTFSVGDWMMNHRTIWDNTQAIFQPLSEGANAVAVYSNHLFMPVINR